MQRGWKAQSKGENALSRGCQSGGLWGGLGRLGVSWTGCAGPRRELKWKFDIEFQMNLNFEWTLRNFAMRFRRNLDVRIFPKFFYASQGFLENKICHGTNASLGQIKLRKHFL
jgi:hypothetical protein